MALSPLAHAQRDVALLSRLQSWFGPRKERLPRSPFGLMMFDAFELRMADVGLPVQVQLDVEARVHAFAIPLRQPAWFAGAETLFDAFLDRHEHDAAARALELLAGRNREWSSAMSLGVESLLRTRLLAARGKAHADEAGRALELFRAVPAPWWETKALRLLGRGEEAERIERRLGIAP